MKKRCTETVKYRAGCAFSRAMNQYTSGLEARIHFQLGKKQEGFPKLSLKQYMKQKRKENIWDLHSCEEFIKIISVNKQTVRIGTFMRADDVNVCLRFAAYEITNLDVLLFKS